MIIALLGVRLDCTSRSERIARALRLFDAAASADTGPEVIVVPAGCDRSGGGEGPHSPAMAESYRAGFCAKAREWGVHIVLGQEWTDTDGSRTAAAMIDADGDVITEIEGNDKGLGIARCATVFGSVGICLESALPSMERAGSDASAPAEVFLVVGGANADPAVGYDIEAALRTWAVRWGCVALLVRPLTESPVDEWFACSEVGVVSGRAEHEAGVVAWAAIGAARKTG